jgi:hypothetical protein
MPEDAEGRAFSSDTGAVAMTSDLFHDITEAGSKAERLGPGTMLLGGFALPVERALLTPGPE